MKTTVERVLEHPSDLTKPKLVGARIMADSDNTTTLPFVTCGRKMRDVVFEGEVTSVLGEKNGKGAAADPALLLSQAWIEAHARTLTLCRRQQRLESELANSVGFPSANILLPDGSEREVSSLEDLQDLLDTTTDKQTSRVEVEALADHWSRWQAKDDEVGYSATKEAEQQAAAKEHLLLGELAKTPARTMEGAIAKLAVILREVEDNHDASDFPLPHIRSVLADLTRVTGRSEPYGSKPSSNAGTSSGHRSASC